MSPDDIFEPSEEAMQAARTFVAAIKGGLKPPTVLSADENPELMPAWHMQMCLHTLLQVFDAEQGRAMNEAQTSVDRAAAITKGAMSGIGVGLASYLSQTAGPEVFFEHIVVCCAKALPLFTHTEGPLQ